MGVDIHLRIVKLNRKENKYEYVQLYRKNEKKQFEKVYFFEGRNHELFDILQNHDETNFPSSCINKINLPPEIKKELDENTEYCYGFGEFNLADAKLYLMRHPTVPDYDAEWPEDEPEIPRKNNPVEWFINDLENYVDLWDWGYGLTSFASDVRVIYWFDH